MSVFKENHCEAPASPPRSSSETDTCLDNEKFLWIWRYWIVFAEWLIKERHLALFSSGSLLETTTIANMWHPRAGFGPPQNFWVLEILTELLCQLFLTFSCTDLRWNELILIISKLKGNFLEKDKTHEFSY